MPILNGGDDSGVFTPLFVKYKTMGDVALLVSLFMGITLMW